MIEIGDPFSKGDILRDLDTVNRVISDYFAALSTELFFAHPDEVWSPAENLQHLILAVNALTKGLKLPLSLIGDRFGKPEKPTRHYAEIVSTYQALLANGGVASGSVIPLVNNDPADFQGEQKRILDDWSKAANELVTAAQSWNEADLNAYQLPHGLLGLMTSRELLLWTIYHNLHHLHDTERLLESSI